MILTPPVTSGTCFIPPSVVEPIVVKAPLAGDIDDMFGNPEIDGSHYVTVRPLPYEPVPQCGDDDNRVRTFIFKGRLVKVPLINLGGNGKKSEKAAPAPAEQSLKPGGQPKSKAWQMVKSKVVGGAVYISDEPAA
mmetsp:Transcript_61355/g.158251  ORF Transcript_61355/g.158251 Transcript_61355/m.158251 type:complete len:135 (+) Transcript_61355:3-407(+)